MYKFTICCVCKSLNKDPQRIKNCNHLVCLECVTKVRKEGATWRCPFCYEIVVKYKLDLVIKEIVDELISAKLPCDLHPNEQNIMISEEYSELDCSGHKFISSDNQQLASSIKDKIRVEKEQYSSTEQQLQEAIEEIEHMKSICTRIKEKQIEQITLKHSFLHKVFQTGDLCLKKALDLNNDVFHFTQDEYSLLDGVKSIKTEIPEYKREKEYVENTYENKYYYNQDVEKEIMELYKILFISYRCYCSDTFSINECKCYYNQINSKIAKTLSTTSSTINNEFIEATSIFSDAKSIPLPLHPPNENKEQLKSIEKLADDNMTHEVPEITTAMTQPVKLDEQVTGGSDYDQNIKTVRLPDECLFMPPSKHKRAFETDAVAIIDHMIGGNDDSTDCYKRFNKTTKIWECSRNCNINGGGCFL